MDNKKLNKYLPYIVAVILFLVLSFAYFPEVIQGKKLSQHDKKTWQGGSHEIYQHKEKTGEHTLWTNSMFGGMPSYLVTNYAPNNWTSKIYKIIDLNHKLRPASFIFMALVGFFIALLLFGVKPWLSLIGAFAFAFSSYNLIIIEAGHITKMIAIAFLPPIIAGIYHAYNKKMLVGSVVMMIFLAIQLLVNHLQITYYTLLIILIYFIFELIRTIKEKKQKAFLKTSGILLIGAIIAISTNFSQIITVYDYGKDSIRGKSELTIDKDNKTSGLDKDYATAWSYGKLETLNLMIPNLVGGASTGEAFIKLKKESETYNLLKKAGYPDSEIKKLGAYWGPQPMTSGPVYIGAIMIFLFVFGLFIVKGNLKWWLLSATILSILLAWGKNFMFLTDLFLDYFPLYNKFRTVSMILVIAQFTIPLLGILALKNIIEKKVTKKEVYKALKWSVGIVSGIIFLFIINPGILSFTSEQEIASGMQKELLDALTSDRKGLFRADAFRSLAFIAISALLLWLFISEKLKETGFIAALGLLILIDLWAVDKRFLNSDDFVSSRIEKEPFTPSNADKFIMKDVDPNFRVLNLTVSTFNDASTSYFHKSIGGYHGAKMRRYQELITYGISNELNMLYTALNESTSELQVQSSLMNLSVINMLNTKYFILSTDMLPMMNQYSLGNAWFVNKIKEVENADEEIKAIQNFDPEQTAVIDKRFKDQFFKFKKDSSAAIKLTSYVPNKITYRSETKSDQLAIFSEIYYAKGWNAYIDGKLVPHMRANYVLRAVKIPAGNHSIEFKFEPEIWETGNTVSLIGSILFFLVIIGGIYFEVKKNKKQKAVS